MHKMGGIYMRFFISVNKETEDAEAVYYRKGLNADTAITIDDLLYNGAATGRDSYKLVESGTQPMKSPVAKRIEDTVHQSPVPKNLFFIESNSAHNISYFTAGIAAKLSAQGQKLLIANFDQHLDHGTATGELLCSNWGGFAKKYFPCDYMVIGEPLYNRKKQFIIYCAGKQNCTAFKIEELHKRLNEYDAIYVTVDMDILINGAGMPKRTNWGEGVLTKQTLMSYLNLLPDGKIISADITGFPPYETANLAKEEINLIQYITDINEIAKKLESKF